MLGISPERSGIRVGCCTSCSRSVVPKVGGIASLGAVERSGGGRVFSGEQIWHDYGQKYIGHEFQQMDGYSTVCEPPLHH